MFPNVAKVMLGILTIPHSNAGCKRIFSCVRKNRTDQRASLLAKTMDSLMVMKSRPGMPAETNLLCQGALRPEVRLLSVPQQGVNICQGVPLHENQQEIF